MAQHSPDELLATADGLADLIRSLRHTLESPKTAVLCAVFLAVWVMLADCSRLGGFSPACYGVAIMAAALKIACSSEDLWLVANSRWVLSAGGFVYLIITEYFLQLRHLNIPTSTGVVFSLFPSFMALLCASTLSQAVCTLGLYAMILCPVSTWWQFNDFLIHCCLICFAVWIKDKLMSLVEQIEKLLEVRGLLLDAAISLKEKQLAVVNSAMELKHNSSTVLETQIKKTQGQSRQMMTFAEEAISLAGHVPLRTRAEATVRTTGSLPIC